MLALQRKQVKEVLDEDVRAWRRVLDREREQVKVFDEVIKPKPEADLQTEVAFEKDVEKLQALLERRINALEEIIRSRGATAAVAEPAGVGAVAAEAAAAEPAARRRAAAVGPARQAEAVSEIFNSAPVVASWNGIVRSISDPSVTQRSRDVMKTKLQEIQGMVNALVYGFITAVNAINAPGITDVQFARFVPRMISAQSVYSLIQKQLFTGSYFMIRQNDVEAQSQDIIANLPMGADQIGTKVKRVLASPVLAPFAMTAADNAAARRAAILAAEQGRPLSAEELARIRGTIFGRIAPVMPLDPALEAELNRIARIETAAKEEIGRREERLPEPYRPPPTYSMLSPEYIAGIERTADEFRDASIRSDRDKLAEILSKYSPGADGAFVDDDDLPGGEEERLEDIDNLVTDIVEVRMRLDELKGIETTRAAQEALIGRKVAALVNNRRESSRRAAIFLSQLKGLMNEYLDSKLELLQIERDDRVKQQKLIPKVGNAKPRFGRMGMRFDDSRNDPYDPALKM
jgi:hypothetical protein